MILGPKVFAIPALAEKNSQNWYVPKIPVWVVGSIVYPYERVKFGLLIESKTSYPIMVSQTPTLKSNPFPTMSIYDNVVAGYNLNGARMTYFSAIMPISDGMGLVFSVTSYDGMIFISPTSCREQIPDPEYFAQCVRDSFQEYLALASKPARAGRKAKRKPKRSAKSRKTAKAKRAAGTRRKAA